MPIVDDNTKANIQSQSTFSVDDAEIQRRQEDALDLLLSFKGQSIDFQRVKEPLIPDDLRQDAAEAFDALMNIPGDKTPLIEKLQKYWKETRSAIEEKRSFGSFLKADQVQELLSRVPGERVQTAFAHLIERLERETSFLEYQGHLGITSALKEGLKQYEYFTKVKFVRESDTKDWNELEESAALGLAFPRENYCLVMGAAPSPKDMWISLIGRGLLPDKIRTLHHELTHMLQPWKDRNKVGNKFYLSGVAVALLSPLYSVLSAMELVPEVRWVGIAATCIGCGLIAYSVYCRFSRKNTDGLLRECFTRSSERKSLCFEWRSSSQIREEVAKAYKNKTSWAERLKGVTIEYSPYRLVGPAFQLVHKLRLLGLDHRELAKLSSEYLFDKFSCRFPELEERLRQEREKQGLQDQKEFELVMKCLDLQEQLEHRLQRQQAMSIAAEELEKAAEKNSS